MYPISEVAMYQYIFNEIKLLSTNHAPSIAKHAIVISQNVNCNFKVTQTSIS